LLQSQSVQTVTAHVDIVVLSRDELPLRPQVERGIASQTGVIIHRHRIIGRRIEADTCRWDTIARARNRGKSVGRSPWLMFVDDDVVVPPGCVATLLRQLHDRPAYGALAADLLHEAHPSPNRHVGMGATLFRRSALQRIEFRWEADRCECQCCCDDLRRLGIAIAYSPTCQAVHLRTSDRAAHQPDAEHGGDGELPHSRAKVALAASPGRILTAFDDRHYDKFRDQFLASLRRSGNEELVTVLGYGLDARQRQDLTRHRGVELVSLPPDRRASPALRRLWDFQHVLAGWDPGLPVAHWDAGDVIFQGSLSPLWKMVRQFPAELLVTREPCQHPENLVVRAWTLSIHDVAARRAAFQLLTSRPWLAAGFTAATARTLRKYLRAAHQLRHSVVLAGSTDWGDATAFNLYCHRHPGSWREIDDCWNYCLAGRKTGGVFIGQDNRFHDGRGAVMHVVHGNAHSFPAMPGFDRLAQAIVAGGGTP
jgi:hypothetical protein